MFELTSPFTRVVVPYDETRLTYLGRRNMIDGKENIGHDHFDMLNFSSPKEYQTYGLEELLEITKNMSFVEEGFVIVDKNFNRCKIKSLEYVKAHYFRGNNQISFRKLLQVVLDNEVDEFLVYCSEQKEIIYRIKKAIDNMYYLAHLLTNLVNMNKKWWKLSSKDFYNEINVNTPEVFVTMTMNYMRNGASIELQMKKWDIYKWEKNVKEFL